jgi:hypothetical protein
MDQLGGDQFLQVVRDGCLRDWEFGNESLARSLVLSRNAGENREPLRIGNRLCNLLQLIVGQFDLCFAHYHNLGRPAPVY